MVSPGQLYLLAVTVMALVALAAAAPVLLGIAREGRERLRRGGPDLRAAPAETEAQSDSSDRRCRHCGAENAGEFAYCRECAGPL
ncbi:hypothetical protein KTS45_16290 [Halomicroarcula limicola]|uniref:DUF7577 domain-containing protein n=1 Tax=Haloarcula limicola TaxID=1429915 RepID=A0A8J8C9S5_9EURY|nr:zinc ribbon domain-containing protein [Halomicroarcula limicola]MBV0925765.1 hypothetical protein [Halomicroarcula limicola]